MIYFLFNPEDNAPYIKEVGVWGNVCVGAIDESLMSYIKLPTAIVVSEEVAYAWKFAGKYKGEISVRENTNSYDQLDISLLQPHKDKFKYIVLETPYGPNDQSEMYGNIYEAHVSEWTELDYEKLGLKWVKYAGVDNNAFIIAYK